MELREDKVKDIKEESGCEEKDRKRPRGSATGKKNHTKGTLGDISCH